MRHPGFDRARRDDGFPFHDHSSRHGGPGSNGGPGGHGFGGFGPGFGALGGLAGGGRGRSGPPPWLAGLFGLGAPERGGRGPRVRRGDVRTAILAVLADPGAEEPNGYQVIQQIAARSGDAWRPSPGSVYPTIQQLQDEGLVEVDDERGHRAVRLTQAGRTWTSDHAHEIAAVWAPFQEPETSGPQQRPDLRPEVGQVMSAVWQIVSTGTPAQRSAAVDVLVDARRRLYGILADGDEASADLNDDTDESSREG